MINRITDNEFKLVSKYEPSGDQPQAIEQLVDNIEGGEKAQILMGATGTGKTYTMSQVISKVNKPTLVIAHNKTLAGQLYGEFKEFFPENAVEYFVSYYDYYQPEAYVPSSDTYIEKDSSVNDEIDKLRHSATSALLERNDVIVVASVSCIYGLGSPKEYSDSVVSLRPGLEISRDKLLNDLVDIQFERNDIDFQRGRFRVRGDVVEIFPASRDEHAFRVEFFGDEIDRIREVEALTGQVLGEVDHLAIFPATHFVTNDDHMEVAIAKIQAELEEQLAVFEKEGKLLEAQRLKQRTEYDIEMLREMGYTNGVENYSRHMDGRSEGEPPYTLLDFFPDDFLHVRAIFVNRFVVLTKADDFFTKTLFDDFFNAIKGTTHDEEDIFSIHLNHLLLWMLASTLRRHASNGSLDNLEEGLLHPFTRNITCDRYILTLLGNLVNFIHIDNPTLCTFNIKVSSLQEFEEDIFHVLTNITSLSKSCRICDRKRYIQALSQGLSKESFP